MGGHEKAGPESPSVLALNHLVFAYLSARLFSSNRWWLPSLSWVRVRSLYMYTSASWSGHRSVKLFVLPSTLFLHAVGSYLFRQSQVPT